MLCARLFSLYLVLVLSWTGPAQAAVPGNTKPWPREVQLIYDEFKAQCKNGGGRFVPDKTFFASETEVTNDGKADWVVEISALDCRMSDLVRFSENAPETGQAYCGTAGCVVTILASTSKGLKDIFSDNVRSWDAVDLGKGRKGLELSVHGTVCGGFGADVCIRRLSWDGKKWNQVSQYKWTDADHLAAQAADAAAGDSYQEAPRHTAKWQFAGKGNMAIAAVVDHPEFAAIGLRCAPQGGISVTVVPMRNTPLPPTGIPMLLDFYGSVEGIQSTQSLMSEQGKPDYSGMLAPGLQSLLSGRDTDLQMLLSLDGGDEWQDMTYVSLTGSTAAVRSLEKACAGNAGTMAAAQAGGQTPVAPLGIVSGYYVNENEACNSPDTFEIYFYDGKRWGLMGGGQDEWAQNVVKALGPIRKLGAKKFELTNGQMQIDVLSPTRIQPTIQDTGAPMRWCPADQIAPNYRVR